eukprot:c21313_g1_i2.p1 GENE.c21313_g1_i2~~c21313_g1_i2.p1  ORF type:complete len:626 (-),score=267.35 c21313_g1_i2:166-2043(-)
MLLRSQSSSVLRYCRQQLSINKVYQVQKCGLHFTNFIGINTQRKIQTITYPNLILRKMSSKSATSQQGKSGKIVLQMKDTSKILDNERCLFKDVRLAIHDGDRIAILGINGAGKSSFMNALCGTDKLVTGEVWRDTDLRIGHLPQEPKLDETKNVIGNVLDGVKDQMEWVKQYEEISAALCEPDANFEELLEKQGQLQTKIDEADAWDLESRAQIVMNALRCPARDNSVTHLSGGERRRVALSRLLIEKPQILLLDEPTNHLDATSVAWLQQYLKEYKGTVVLVTHDRYFLDTVVSTIIEIDRGNVYKIEGNYTKWLEKKEERLRQEKIQENRLEKAIRQELEWIRSSPQKKQLINKNRLKLIQDLEHSDSNNNDIETGQIMIPAGPRLGNLVINASDLCKNYGDRRLFSNLSFKLQKGWTVGVVGGNGVGKSTLIKILMGQEAPDSGQIVFGSTVSIGHLSQSRMSLSEDKTVFGEISGGQEFIQVGDRLLNARTYVAQFNFKGPAQEKKIGMLSGGERNRVHLAKALREGYNVLLLDEPTNDLDVDTLRALEDALPHFNGCAVVVSHDRWFLNRICTHILAFEPNGEVIFFNGTFDEYETDRLRRSQRKTKTTEAEISSQATH